MTFKIFLSIFLLTGNIFAQSIRYSKTIDENYLPNGFNNGIQLLNDATAILDGSVVLYPSSDFGYVFSKINYNTGDTIVSRVIYDSSISYRCGYGSNAINYYNKAYYGCGLFFDSISKAFIVKYDTLLNVQWKKHLYFGNQIRIDAGLLAKDSNLVFAGSEELSGEYGITLFKTDTAANILWKRNFPVSSVLVQPFSLGKTSDGGYLISGYYWPISGVVSDYVLKTDSMGVMQWQKIIPGSFGRNQEAYSKVLSNGNILLFGAKDSIAGSTKQFANLYLLNNLGDTLWSKTYLTNTNLGSYFNAAVELSDGTVMLTGGTSGVLGLNRPAGVLFKIDIATGDSIWCQYYKIRNNDNYFNNLVQLSNGDLLIEGYVFPDGGTTTEDGWLVRTDSMGCLVGGCYATGIEQIEAGSEGLSIYPNPATNQITIEFDASAPFSMTAIEIKNVLGQTVKAITNAFTKGTNKMEVDVSDLSSGLYFVQMKSENKTVSKKFIKE